MSSISGAKPLRANGIELTAPPVPGTWPRNVIRLLGTGLAAASLAACAQSSVVSKRSDFFAPTREAAREHNRGFSFLTASHVTGPKKTAPSAPYRNATETHVASHGLASFYTEGTKTANGEKFDTHALTAAHPTLPFGTQLRVTNEATGKSVTVRVNDRGPFVPGRSVDVSYAAAERLGMVGAGVAKVKLDVVQ